VKVATASLVLGTVMMSLAAVGVAPSSAVMAGVLALVIGAFALVIAMGEPDLAPAIVEEPRRDQA
jgi:hypothetical protein